MLLLKVKFLKKMRFQSDCIFIFQLMKDVQISFYITFLFVTILSFQGSAQEESIEGFEDYFLVKTEINNRSLHFSIFPRSDGKTLNEKIIYSPSVSNTFGIGANFKRFGLSFNFKLSQDSELKNRQGESDYLDFQFRSFGKKLGFDVYYQNYQGYFISNPNEVFLNFDNSGTLPRRDDLRIQNISTNIFYVFNSDRFSYRAAFVHDERQVKSAGSFILTGSLGYFHASADSSFIPPNTNIEFQPTAFFNTSDFYTLALTPGYACNLIFFKNFYLNLGLSALLGLQYQEVKSDILNETGFNPFFKGIFRTGLGYNGKTWVTGLSLSGDIQAFTMDFVQYNSTNLNISLFLAYRIKTNLMKGKKTFFDLLKKKKK